MGKNVHRRAAKEPPSRQSTAESAPLSLLRLAWDCHQRGDVVVARAAAKRLLGQVPSAADEVAARDIGRELSSAQHGVVAPVAARDIAKLIYESGVPPAKTYLFAVVAALIIAALIALAMLRSP